MNSQQVLRAVRSGGMWVAIGVLAGLAAGCGDGGSSTSSTTASSDASQVQPITQSDIVLPSSVQVVTAK